MRLLTTSSNKPNFSVKSISDTTLCMYSKLFGYYAFFSAYICHSMNWLACSIANYAPCSKRFLGLNIY